MCVERCNYGQRAFIQWMAVRQRQTDRQSERLVEGYRVRETGERDRETKKQRETETER